MENQKDQWNTWVVCLGQVRLRESQQEERLVIDSCGSKLHKGIRYGKDFWFAVVDDFYYFQPSIHPFKIFIMPATHMDFVNFSILFVYLNRCILQYHITSTVQKQIENVLISSMKSLTNMLIFVDPKTEIHRRNSGPSCLSPPCDAIGIGQVATSRAPNRRVAGETFAFLRIHWDLFR